MAEELLMPKLGMTMEEGVLTEWFKQAGDEVEKGDPVFEVMTDKINIEVEAPRDGVLLKIIADEGETIPVNQVVGYIGEAGEEVPEEAIDAADSKAIPSDKKEEQEDLAAKDGQTRSAEIESAGSVETVQTRTLAEDSEEKEHKDHTQTNQAVRATPSARRLARIHNIDLSNVSGTGPRGRIQARDVEMVAEGRDGQGEAAEQRQEVRPASERVKEDVERLREGIQEIPETAANYEEVPLRGIRKVIGERMVQSKQQIPHVTLNRWVTMTAANQFKKDWEEDIRAETGYKFSLNDLLAMAVARALRQHPELNATLEGDIIRQYKDINIGIAVQTDDGLMVPVIHEVNRLNAGELVTQIREKVEKARARKLSPADTTGGTFTISNLGGFDIETFNPIINSPEVAILGVGKMVTQPEWDGNTWQPVPKMPFSLSFDHRVVDGAPAAEFIQTLAHYLKAPRKLLI